MNQKIEELKNLIQSFIRNPISAVKMPQPVTIATCYDDLATREKKKVVEETTFHEANKLDFGFGSGAYGEDDSYHEFLDDFVSPVKAVAEDLGQKLIHDSDETSTVIPKIE